MKDVRIYNSLDLNSGQMKWREAVTGVLCDKNSTIRGEREVL